jgi:pimeloyl-ACP methyl ester carboxylesterase
MDCGWARSCSETGPWRRPSFGQAFAVANAPRVFQFFAAVPELPELLTSGRERDFLAWLFRNKSIVKNAIREEDLDAYVASYSRPGRMSAGFGYYRAVPKDIEQNRAAPPPPMPVLAVGAEGSLGPALQNAIRTKRPDARGEIIIGVGHYLLEEAPNEFVELLLPFLRS